MTKQLKDLRRSSSDAWIGGVCGGIAAFLDIPSWVVRILWFIALFAYGAGALLYILLWIFMPEEKNDENPQS